MEFGVIVQGQGSRNRGLGFRVSGFTVIVFGV